MTKIDKPSTDVVSRKERAAATLKKYRINGDEAKALHSARQKLIADAGRAITDGFAEELIEYTRARMKKEMLTTNEGVSLLNALAKILGLTEKIDITSGGEKVDNVKVILIGGEDGNQD